MNDISIEKVIKLRNKIHKKAQKIIAASLKVNLEENDSEASNGIINFHRLAANLNASNVAVMIPSDDINKFNYEILVGGYLSSDGEYSGARNGKPLTPYFQIDLSRIGKFLGFEAKDRYLELLINDDDWGSGKAEFRFKTISDEDIEHSVIIPSEREATASDILNEPSYVSFLKGEAFGKGCLTLATAETLSAECPDLEELEELCEEMSEKSDDLTDLFLDDQFAIGSVHAEAVEWMILSERNNDSSWLPMAKLNGPRFNPVAGVLDFYSVFYKVNEANTLTDIMPIYYRWRL